MRGMRTVAVNDKGLPIGQDHHRAKLSNHEVELVLQMREAGMHYVEIAAKFEISKTMVCYICLGLRRNHIICGQKTLPARSHQQ